MSNIEYNPSINDKVNGQLGDLNVPIQIPLSSIKTLFDETPPIPPVPPAPYKVFTALVTQSGGDDPQGITSGSLTKGVTYRIESGDGDYSNVGAPNNDEYTYFVATANAEPTTWGSLGLGFNSGAPTVKVLENTIGDIWFTFEADSTYNVRSNSLFTIDKTYAPSIIINSTPAFVTVNTGGTSIIELISSAGNNVMTNTPLEIRVYN
jgi:hypothetical protein